jgi:DNA-3-methyladenine glycosylase II
MRERHLPEPAGGVAPRSLAPDYWAEACRELTNRDRVLAGLIRAHRGHLTSRGRAFETLARSIVGQQISVHAAESVWKRLAQAAGRVSPPRVAALGPEALRDAGLSRNKARYLHELAVGFASGRVRPRRWRGMEDEAIVAELMAFPGVGRWTAEMFLIFHLLRPDVLPVDDLGLRRGMALHYGLGSVDRDIVLHLGRRWRPWCTVATWYLWRSLDPRPVAY